MRKGLFVLFLMLIIAFFVIGYQSEQRQSHQSHPHSTTMDTVSETTW
ncbi:hypothetical protein GCM10012290_20080 [Halolactibacillus alkaliphilus]|uniref:Uncharacterized protein n=1 Tax=Halolactibacillus alkaliphilus TaxID=442899 RepID=A0A511X3N2_9BACI|nr:hypothetical protein [Halolactibacillus alkaliphilus]GEN57558.1 hypothetical protein HAL01_20220 [Halolactibacillus alkaliphilus]GGN73347.1 hypothetical protein GCM10012290_20080 [Halolactibacillus alkaliphilus]SFO96222.1 hypothetical protein SAMN05720591_12624 [Halolactibacillus alkaliphilus]